VSASFVVEDLEILEDRIRKFDSSLPALSVETNGQPLPASNLLGSVRCDAVAYARCCGAGDVIGIRSEVALLFAGGLRVGAHFVPSMRAAWDMSFAVGCFFRALTGGIEVGDGLGPPAGETWRVGLTGENGRPAVVDLLLKALRKVPV
jgi:hypothetical protein